jgi:hypothetical protein
MLLGLTNIRTRPVRGGRSRRMGQEMAPNRQALDELAGWRGDGGADVPRSAASRNFDAAVASVGLVDNGAGGF